MKLFVQDKTDRLVNEIMILSVWFQITREAEAAVFHRQVFEELTHEVDMPANATLTTSIAAVEASFKCLAGAIIVLTKTGR